MNNTTLLITEAYNTNSVIQAHKTYFDKESDTINKFFGSVENFVKEIEAIDPLKGSENVNTIIIWLKKGIINISEIKTNEVQNFTFSEFFSVLDKVLKRNKLPDEMKDIRKYVKTRTDLLELMHTVYEIEEEMENKTKKGRGLLLFTGKNGTRFYESLDIVHSCYIGKGSKWCTAITRNIDRNQYYFIRESGYRIITFIPLNNKNNEKYQFNLFSFLEYTKYNINSNKFEILVFDRLNKLMALSELDDKLYEDLIDFLFNELSTEFNSFIDNYVSTNNYKKMIKLLFEYTKTIFLSSKFTRFLDVEEEVPKILLTWPFSNTFKSFTNENLKKFFIDSKHLFKTDEHSRIIYIIYLLINFLKLIHSTRDSDTFLYVDFDNKNNVIGTPVDICDFFFYRDKPKTLISFLYFAKTNLLDYSKNINDKIKVNAKTGEIIENE